VNYVDFNMHGATVKIINAQPAKPWPNQQNPVRAIQITNQSY